MMNVSKLIPINAALFTKTEKSDYGWKSSYQAKLAADVHKGAIIHLLASSKKLAPLFCVYKVKNHIGLLLGGLETERHDADNRIIKSSLFLEFQAQDEEKVLSTVAYLLRSSLDSLAEKLKPFVEVAEVVYQEIESGEKVRFEFPAVVGLEPTDRAYYPSESHIEYFKHYNELFLYSTEESNTKNAERINRRNYANFVLSELKNFTEYCFVSTDILSLERCQALAEIIKTSTISSKNSKSDLKVIILSCSESVKKLPELTLFDRLDDMALKASKGLGIFFLVFGVGLLTAYWWIGSAINEQRKVNDSYETKANELEVLLVQENNKKNNLETEISTLKLTKKVLEDSITGLRKETDTSVYEEAKAELKKLEKERTSLQSEINYFNQQLRDLEKEKETLIANKQKELKDLQDELDRKRFVLINDKESSGDATESSEEINILKTQVSTLQKQLEESKKEIMALKDIEGKQKKAKDELKTFLATKAKNSDEKLVGLGDGLSVEEVLRSKTYGKFYNEKYCDKYLALRKKAEELSVVGLGEKLCEDYKKKVSSCQCYNVVPKYLEKTWFLGVTPKNEDYYLPRNINQIGSSISSPRDKDYYDLQQEESCKNKIITIKTPLSIFYNTSARFKTSYYEIRCGER